MDDGQRRTILKSVGISSGRIGGLVSQQDRQDAFRILEEFKSYEGRIPICISWLHQDQHVAVNNDGMQVDVTVSTKLYVLSLLQSFCSAGYAKLNPQDRLALRDAVVLSAKQLAPSPLTDETRILGNKVASLLADLMVRDFPQRWTTFFQDLFVPINPNDNMNGGLWCGDIVAAASIMGVKMGLECMRLVTEDCTDSDFNTKISTSRRNDVLIGLNEVSSLFLPLIFSLLEQYPTLVNTKSTLHNMRTFLASNGRTLSQMTTEENAMYQTELTKLNQTGRLIADCLATLERFCHSMPLEWILGNQGADGTENDFVSAFLHLLREPASSIQIHAVACLEQLATRKLDTNTWWFRFVATLPQAVNEANQTAQVEQERLQSEQVVSGAHAVNLSDTLTSQLQFHRALSKMLALMISAHIANITNDKQSMSGSGSKSQSLSTFIRLLVDMLHHPSGRICSEQINTWIALLRDPQIVKTNILTPIFPELLTCYMDKMVRVRWENVEEQTHPHASLLEASWDDEDEYDDWLSDLRSKSSQLFRFSSHSEPKIASSVLSDRVQALFVAHGAGEPRNYLDPNNNQLTPKSEACLQFEGLYQPLENILNGIPEWALQEDGQLGPERLSIQTSVRASLSQVANTIVSWNPAYVWLKFRRATLLEALRHYWKYDPSTLLPGVDSLLGYLNAPDDWKLLPSNSESDNERMSGEVVGLRKKSGIALVSVAKIVPQHLVPWISQLSEATKKLLSSQSLLPPNRMHLYEFLSCVATAVTDPTTRSNFIADVLSDALNALESPDVLDSISSVERFLTMLGILQASKSPSTVTDPVNVKAVTAQFVRLFSSINQLLSVGKRCHEAARKRDNGGIPLQSSSVAFGGNAAVTHNFPDEGPVGIRDLAANDPFVPLWPRILPRLLQVLDVILNVWHPEDQAILLSDPIQRYAYAISDDEAYLSKQHDNKSGGVFGQGGTAGSVVAGYDRRDANLAPKWSGWLNELRNTSLQMLGLVAGQRALFAPETAGIFPRFVAVVANNDHLQAMEHRHLTQYMKQFVEILLLSCPATMYATHLAPIVTPVFEHMQYRLQMSWSPLIGLSSATNSPRALSSPECGTAAALASRGGEAWFAAYYARAGLFVGDLDVVSGEAVLEKHRVDLSRVFSDVLQSALALKGDWALVRANQAKEENAVKMNDPSKLSSGPRNRLGNGQKVNADGTPRAEYQEAIDARKQFRISAMSHFLFLEDERIAGCLTVTIIQCLGYPDAYTCRRCTKIGHRILESVAWSPKYTHLLGHEMFLAAAKNIVTEPKWMVGIEWDMMNLLRDIYCRLVLGQTLQPGGQGPGLQQPRDSTNPSQFEQAKTADRPLQGGGILVSPSDLPRQILASLPGVGVEAVQKLDKDMAAKRAAKDQKDFLRDLLRVAAENAKLQETSESGGAAGGIFDRAVAAESLLNQKVSKAVVPDIPEKLVTVSMMQRKESQKMNDHGGPHGLSAFQL